MNHASRDSGITMNSRTQTTMIAADNVAFPVFSVSLKETFLSRVYRANAPSAPLMNICACLNRIPAILKALFSGRPRREQKYLKAVIWQDAVLGYYAICVGMTLWFQYHLFDFKQLGIVLAWWTGLCMFFRFLRSSGKQPIKP